MFMDYDNINKIGKIKTIDKEYGVGEIVAIDDLYLFTVNDIKEDLNVGDIVKFRGEEVNEEKRAFFVDKIDETFEIKNNMIKSKIFNKE